MDVKPQDTPLDTSVQNTDVSNGCKYIVKVPFEDEDEKWYSRFWFFLRRIPKKIKRFFFGYGKCVVKTGLSDQWWDSDTRILHANMQILKEFVEEEMHIVAWDEESGLDKVGVEIRVIYNWWMNYKNRQDEILNALTVWNNAFMDGLDRDDPHNFLQALNRPRTEDEREKNEKLHQLENKLLDEENDMLIRLIKIRSYLWS